MKQARPIAVWLLLLIGMALAASGGEIIDRIVAVVNGQPILESEWDEAVRCEAFLDGRPLEQVTPESQRAALERLIDQELLHQQMIAYRFPPSADDDVQKRMAEIRSQIPGATDERAWKTALQKYGITEAELGDRVRAELEIVRFLDVRLRPAIRVDQRSVQAYYRDSFLPELRKAGAKEVPLADVAPKIREVLVQQRMDEMLNQWIKALREQSDIRFGERIGESVRAEGSEAK